MAHPAWPVASLRSGVTHPIAIGWEDSSELLFSLQHLALYAPRVLDYVCPLACQQQSLNEHHPSDALLVGKGQNITRDPLRSGRGIGFL